MLSSDDATVLQSIGHDIIHAFVAVTVETFAIGECHSADAIEQELNRDAS